MYAKHLDIPLLKSITASLRSRNLLLVLDNFEQVIGAASHVLSLLVGALGLKILVTSREALHVSGEYEFPLAPSGAARDFSFRPVVGRESHGSVFTLFIRAIVCSACPGCSTCIQIDS